jgi:hypothetical protein
MMGKSTRARLLTGPLDVWHADAALGLGRQQPHDGRLDDRHEAHVGVRGDRNGGQQVRRQLGRDEDARRPVDRADDADGRRLVERELAGRQRQQQHREDAELSGRADEHHARVGKQRAEVGHRADADEQEQREELGLDAGLIKRIEDALGLLAGHDGAQVQAHACAGDVRQDRAHADGDEQDRLVFLGDGQVDEQAADGEHEQVGPGELAQAGEDGENVVPPDLHSAPYASRTSTSPYATD